MSLKKNTITYALYADNELKIKGNASAIGDYLGIKPICVYALYKRLKESKPRKYKGFKMLRTDIFENEANASETE